MLGLGLRLRLPCLARVGVLEEVHLEVLKTWRSVEDLAREEHHLEDRPWDDLENYYLVRFQEVLTPVRVSGVGTGGDTVRSPSN